MDAAYAAFMTITEHLEFSVLTAPVAALDRRVLSQAWYSALYGERGVPQTNMPAAKAQPRPAVKASPHSVLPDVQVHGRGALLLVTRNGKCASVRGAEIERRSPRSPLARKIERAFLRPSLLKRKATFSIDGKQGRVQVILQSQGSQIKLIAICAPKAKAQVASALAQARYALALRGIDLDAQAREQAAC